MKDAWNFVWNYLFSYETNLFYDHMVEMSSDGATKHLPLPELIKRQIPNPNGWSTGMEDSVLCGGMMLDVIIARYKMTKEPAMKTLARKVYKGLELCATVSAEKGFIARSVSPVDKKSHYSNSSRDQYTHFIYSACRYYLSDLCEDTDKSSIRDILVQAAARFETYVTPENGYNFPREDNKNGMVFQMWGEIGKHEYLRLPMFYAAAWKFGDEKRFKDLYMQYRDEAIEKSFGIAYDSLSTAYPILQMQYSLKFLYDLEEDIDFRNKCRKLMDMAAEAFQKKLEEAYCLLTEPACRETVSYRYNPWEKEKGVYLGCFGGIAYYNHNQDIYKENRAYYLIRNIGDAAAIMALAGKHNEKAVGIVERTANLINWNNHYNNAPINLLNAFWLMRSIG
jgi:hypothetical protein